MTYVKTYYKVVYFHRGYHSKNFEDANMALSAFLSIPVDFSPLLKKINC